MNTPCPTQLLKFEVGTEIKESEENVGKLVVSTKSNGKIYATLEMLDHLVSLLCFVKYSKNG